MTPQNPARDGSSQSIDREARLDAAVRRWALDVQCGEYDLALAMLRDVANDRGPLSASEIKDIRKEYARG